MKLLASLALICFLSGQLFAQSAQDWVVKAAELCKAPNLSGLDAQARISGSWLLQEQHRPDQSDPRFSTVRLALPNAGELQVERRTANGQLRQFRIAYSAPAGEGLSPTLQAIADGSCRMQSARAIRSGVKPWVYLDQLEGDLETLRWAETLQAPWPEGTDPGGVRVGFVDSGLAYDLPLFTNQLARDKDGVPVGYDYWDLDPWPYDGDTSRGAFFPIRHGTTVASVFVREAPRAAIVPYKYPRPDMSRLGDLVRHAERDGVRILAMPLGSRTREDWTEFTNALLETEILAIVSAGNDGVDIDSNAIYPAVLDLPNLITVTSSDGFGRLARGSNWGNQSVDIMLPAENLPITDFRGASGVASGSSYAVPRLAAMAARMLETEPDLTAIGLRHRIFERAKPSPFERGGVLAVGWISDPLSD